VKVTILALLCLIATANSFALETDVQTSQNEDTSSFFLLPFGYDFLRLGDQNIHLPAIGGGYMSGERNIPFDEVEHRIFGIAMYRPIQFSEAPLSGMDKLIHQIDFLADWRIKRHQLLLVFKSAADKPVFGGLNTFQAGMGWGYEVIRKQHVSLILGAALGISDFGIPSPVLPLPLVRFGIDTQWFTSSFDFLTGPNLEFTITPNGRIRLTGDMRMDHYRNINDLVCEFILWYRLFDAEHQYGDIAGIGLGFKNDSVDFFLSDDSISFELQHSSVFAAADLSLLRIEAGWIFESRYLIDGIKTGSPGRGFYLSIQGIFPIAKR